MLCISAFGERLDAVHKRLRRESTLFLLRFSGLRSLCTAAYAVSALAAYAVSAQRLTQSLRSGLRSLCTAAYVVSALAAYTVSA